MKHLQHLLVASMLLLTYPFVRAEAINGTNSVFYVNDALDRGCKHQAANAKSACPTCNTKGVPDWWVSEPYINLWVSDKPAAYTTSLGTEMSFQITYNQRDMRPTNSYYQGGLPLGCPATGWNHNWFSYIRVQGSYNTYSYCVDFSQWTARVFMPGGGESDYAYNQKSHPSDGTQLLPFDGQDYWVAKSSGFPRLCTSVDDGRSGFRLVYPDGSQDIYSDYYLYDLNDPYETSFNVPLTERIDPFGNVTRLYYDSTTGLGEYVLLQYVVDPDGKTNTFTYNAQELLTRVDMANGSYVTMGYNAQNQMTSISDAMQMLSSFAYNGANKYMTNMTTPYGTTYFTHTDLGTTENGIAVGNAGGTNRVSRACLVTLPTTPASYELYAYRFDSSEVGIPDNYTNQAPNSTPLNTLDTGGTTYLQSMSYLRNSYQWNAKQYSLLSTTVIPSLTATDYNISSMSHWLVSAGTTNYLSSTISFTRDPSPDGTQAGQITWFDYPGRTGSTLWSEGTNAQQTAVIAQMLPDSSTKYSWTQYEPYGKVTNSTSTYTKDDGTIGTRSYAAIYTNVTFSMQDWAYFSSQVITTAYWTNSMLTAIKGPESETLLTASGLTNTTVTLLIWPNNTTYTNIYTLPVYVNEVLTDVSNNVTTVNYNGRHQIAGISYPTGLHRTNYYDGNGFLSKTIDLEIARTNGFSFVNGVLATQTNEMGMVSTYSWDNLQRLVSITYPDTTTVSNFYTFLDLTSQKDRLNRWSYATYDSMRNMLTCKDKRGNQSSFSYCTCGTLDSIQDPTLNSTAVIRDNVGRITQVSYASEAFSQFSYDSVGHIVSATNSAGMGLTNTYNNQGLLIKTTGAYGPISQASYNIYDQADYRIDGSGIAVTNTYDLLGRVASTMTANGTNLYLYSGKLLVATVDPLNRTNWYAYDAAGRNTYTTNANLVVRQILYDAAGHVVSLSDGRDLPTTWAYDIYGRNIAETNASGVVVRTNGYNANGDLVAMWTKAKGLTLFTPDENGNVTSIAYPISGTNNYTYDPLDRIQTMSNAVGSSTFSYQSLGAFTGGLLTEVEPWTSDTVTLTYGNGLVTNLNLSQPSGSVNQGYAYDRQLRLQSLASSLAGTFNFSYNAAGGQIITNASGADTIIQAFDAVGNLTSTTLKDPLNNIVDPMSYNYNAAGVITNLIRGTEASKVFYTYDKIDQIATALGYEASGTARYNETFGYSYDNAGNWATRTNGALSQQATVNGLDDILSIRRNTAMTVAGSLAAPIRSLYVYITNYSQGPPPQIVVGGGIQPLQQIPPGASNGTPAALYQDLTWGTTAGVSLLDGTNWFQLNMVSLSGVYTYPTVTQMLPVSVNFTYDDNRNLLSDGTRNFTYDDANRLVEIYVTNSWNNWRSTYAYDGLSRRRIRKDYTWQSNSWSLNNETHYLYAGSTVIQERNSLNQPTVTYTRGNGLLARTDTNGTCYYHIDGNHNVTALVNSQGTLVARYIYDPYGNLLESWGSMADANLYRFASQEVHPLSGLYAYPFRFYDPNLGRWINRDPIGFWGGRNPFVFVGNNPINAVDPDGLDSLVPGVNGSYNNSVPALTLTGQMGGPVTTSYAGPDSLFAIGAITMGGMAVGGVVENSPGILLLAGATILDQLYPTQLPPGTQIGVVPSWLGGPKLSGPKCSPKGGVYLLRDPETGQVMRTGRTSDFLQREAQHARDPQLSSFDFEPIFPTDTYAQQRGLEQTLHDLYNPPLNFRNPISPSNPNRQLYLNAAQTYLNK